MNKKIKIAITVSICAVINAMVSYVAFCSTEMDIVEKLSVSILSAAISVVCIIDEISLIE